MRCQERDCKREVADRPCLISEQGFELELQVCTVHRLAVEKWLAERSRIEDERDQLLIELSFYERVAI